MNYTEFVEKLMKMITEETGYKAAFFEATPKLKEDKVLVCTEECDEHRFIMGLPVRDCYFAWKKGKITMEKIVQGLKEGNAIFETNEMLENLEYQILNLKKISDKYITFFKNFTS